MITLPNSNVLLEFVRCEKKAKKKKKGNKKKKKKKKRTRRGDNENNKVYFFAKFSDRSDFCKGMREEEKAESGVRLCASKKVADQVLVNNCKSVLQTRLRYSQKRKHYFIKAPRTKADKPGVKRVVGAIDLGLYPLDIVHTLKASRLQNTWKREKS